MYKIYYTGLDGSAFSMDFPDDQMCQALAETQALRKKGFTFVTMVCENPNQVGKMGVDAVTDGVLPDGTTYEWRKRRA